MNTLRNSVKLIGRLGQDPEVKTLDKGNKVATFSLATSDNFTAKDGSKQEQTQWHNIGVGQPGRHLRKIPEKRQGNCHRRAPHLPQLGR